MLCALALAGIEFDKPHVHGGKGNEFDKPHVHGGKGKKHSEGKKHALAPALHEDNPHLHAGKNSCPTGCTLKQSFIAHADPMMKVNGSSQHFWLTEGVMTPLFEWSSPLDAASMTIEGKTFSRASSGNQWFSKFVIKQNSTAVCEVSLDKTDSGSMVIKLDGKDVKPPSEDPHGQHSSANNGIQLSASKSQTDRHEAEQESLNVEAGGLTLRIFSSKAAKFANKAQQTHYMHLNIQIEGDLAAVPDARGIFAELSGLRPMSAATSALLKQKPKHTPTALVAAEQGTVRHDSPEIPGELMLQQTGSHCFCPPTSATANTAKLGIASAKAADAPASATSAPVSTAGAPASATITPPALASATNESANATAAAASLVAWHGMANSSRSGSQHQIVIAHAHQIADVLFRQDVKWNFSRFANFFFNA